jgi:hypothetical protein
MPHSTDATISLEDLVKPRAQASLRVLYELTETLLSFEHRHSSAGATKTLLSWEHRHHFDASYRKDWKKQTQATCKGSYGERHKLG